ncbi:hypothetical protein QEZ54_11850 [Catellatospora sp. KI3]|uniref:hypothetical protein n=1 Tax=Catellatospora sp. KI3 TaxID=3041620 RepID=UPI0024830594|nr:hypothetical protein [Catellatospora sp. KI3]MDI1461667.1 hypothetical protein [Catellatospora sp. KI3]
MSTVDLDLLADYVDGALDGTPDEALVADLVAHDPAWAEAADRLRTALPLVSADLALLAAATEPMPADLAARFDELLAGPQFAAVPAPLPRPGTGERALDRRPVPADRRRRRWAVPVGVAAAALAVAGVSLPLSQFGGDVAFDSAAEKPASAELFPSVPLTASGEDYNRNTIAPNVRESAEPPVTTLSTKGTPKTSATDDLSARTPAELQYLATSQPALVSCLSAVLSSTPGTVELVDFARFEGHPAIVLSIAGPDGHWVVAAGPQCGVNGSDELFRIAAE